MNENINDVIFQNIPIGMALINKELEIFKYNKIFIDLISSVNNSKFDGEIKLTKDYNNYLLTILKYQTLDAIKKGKSINDLELDILIDEGKHFWFNISIIPINIPEETVLIELENISSKKLIENEIKNTNNILRSISDYSEKIREEERKKIAFWLHDDIGQALTGIKMDITGLEMEFGENIKLKDHFNIIHKQIDDCIVSIRRISSDLRPHILDHFDICQALEYQLNDLSDKSGFRVIFEKNIDKIDLPDSKKTTIYRIMQEIFINIVRHSKANEVKLIIKLISNLILFTVIDNGIGISQEIINSPKSFGLMAIKERVRSLNGKIEYSDNNGIGTKITLTTRI